MPFNIKKSANYNGTDGFNFKGSGGGLRTKIAPVLGIAPDTLSGLVAWFKADAITGIADGDPMTSWTDSSTSANNLTSYEGTPTYDASNSYLNNQPAVIFDGADSLYLSSPSNMPYGSQATTIYLIGYWDGYVGGQAMFSWGANTGEGSRWGAGSDGTSGIHFEIAGKATKFRAISANTGFILVNPYTAGSALSSVTTYLNGVGLTGELSPPGDGTPNITNPVAELAVGRPATAAGERWRGAIAEVIVYNTTHGPATRIGVQKYLSDKYGIPVT
jgi:hypothetical protein